MYITFPNRRTVPYQMYIDKAILNWPRQRHLNEVGDVEQTLYRWSGPDRPTLHELPTKLLMFRSIDDFSWMGIQDSCVFKKGVMSTVKLRHREDAIGR